MIKREVEFFQGYGIRMAMVKSIVDFANSSGMSTCLEGVETEELQNYLRGYQATWFQGYYYSKPVEIAKFWELVREK